MADTSSRTGKQYFSRDLLDWVAKVHAPDDEGLRRANESPERHQLPAIQVAPSEGRMLELLLRLISARQVVEIGTLAGYSTIRLARGLSPGGKVWSLELDARHAEVARDNLQRAGLASSTEVLVGPALELLPSLTPHGPFDAVFIDADKENYDRYGRWAAANLRPGGLLLGDNAFLFGELLDPTPRAEAMRRFHEEAALAFHSVCVPTPDGLLIGIRK